MTKCVEGVGVGRASWMMKSSPPVISQSFRRRPAESREPLIRSRSGAGCGTRRRPVAAALSGSTGTEQALVELTTLLRLELPVPRLVA
jgi:hypothetical protein